MNEPATEKWWVNSGDSHYLEPDDFYRQILPKKLADRMPRSEKDGDFETVHIDGETMRRKIPSMARVKGADGRTILENSYRPPGSTDIVARIRDLDQEGVWGEVVYPSLGLWNSRLRDSALVREAVRATNRWVRTEVQGVSERLIPVAQVSLLEVDDAVAEVEHAASIGLHAIVLPTGTPAGVEPYNSATWDPLWNAINDSGMVLTFHIGSDGEDPVLYRGPGGAVLNYVETTFGGQRVVMQLISSGVFDRYPNVRVLISEGGASWAPGLGDRMNEVYRQHGTFVRPTLKLPPKEYLNRHVYASFQHDESAVAAYTAMGYRNVMWGSDYPHLEGTYGHTQETLHKLFDDESDEVRYRVCIGSFLDLFPHIGEPPQAATKRHGATATAGAAT